MELHELFTNKDIEMMDGHKAKPYKIDDIYYLPVWKGPSFYGHKMKSVEIMSDKEVKHWDDLIKRGVYYE